jgi:uncharacterized protein (UPF0261 family)/ABC-type branched-subunit amino acid transport system ATPase component
MAEARVPVLEVQNLHVYYGHAHALQGVSLTLEHGVLAVVGRNGMGKTTLCNAIMGLVPVADGTIRIAGADIAGLHPDDIANRGLGYVPQGRRLWPSLTVDEHLRLAGRNARGAGWTVARVYDTFPRLKERQRHGGAQLSGGEQQMLAIGRALLANPKLLIMDEPTEGLAPVIVDQVTAMLHALAEDGSISVLLVEQNLGVATEASDRIAVMVNGRIARTIAAADLARDSDLQHRLLGVRSGDEAEAAEERPLAVEPEDDAVHVYTIRRSHGAEDAEPQPPADAVAGGRARTRWGGTIAAPAPARDGGPRSEAVRPAASAPVPAVPHTEGPAIEPIAIGRTAGRAAYVVGTFDTKGRELGFLKTCIERLGVRAVTVDLSTSRMPSAADIGPPEVARHHPRGAGAVFTGDRGTAVAAMGEAFERFIVARRDLAGVVSAGGSGGTAMATRGMQALPVGVPKVMVSTVASGDVRPYVGPADICMMYSVTDIQGLNRISERVLSNAAHALAGMIGYRRDERAAAKPAVGLTMFGLTTPCVQAVAKALEPQYDCLVFHATGTGGRSMEKLADSHLLVGVVDVTTTEVCDLLMGGVFAAGPDRFGAVARTGIPYVGSCGALDMVNFHARDTVPDAYRGRLFYQHNPNVTLMRTTAEENARVGRWIGERLNRMEGPVRFLIPEGGVSQLDRPGGPFWDPAADQALFGALQSTVQQTARRKLVRLPHHINDPAFAAALAEAFGAVMAEARRGGPDATLSARRAS